MLVEVSNGITNLNLLIKQ